MTPILLLATLALASPPMELVPRGGSAKTMTAVVSTTGASITPSQFLAAVMDCDHYPMTAAYMGVKALLECKTLDHRTDGYTIVYQRTGGNALLSSRQYVIAMKTVEDSDTRVKIEWDLVKHTGEAGAWSGPYASTLNAHPDAVLTPYNTGVWTYDTAKATVAYRVQSDPGGTVPGWLVSQDAVMAFPMELLKVKFGVSP